jgi:DNA primase
VKIGMNIIEQEYNPREDYLLFYTKILGNVKKRKFPWYKAFCPFHEDHKTPNLSINIISGHYKCFACGAKGGPEEFIVQKNKQGYTFNFVPNAQGEHLNRLSKYEEKHMSELDMAVEESRVDTAHEFLFRQPFAIQKLTKDRGLTIETIKKYKIGYLKGAITIPIYNKNGKFVSLKFHKKYQTEGAVTQLFPWDALNKNYVVLVEGELDAIILQQHGINGITQTSGANGWLDEFNKEFHKKIVYLAYDNDSVGRFASINVGKKLWEENINVFLINWPFFMGDKEDNVDYFTKHKKTKLDYFNLLKQSTSIISTLREN